MDQPKIERVLRLMQLMSGPVNYTVDELAAKLETSYRSIYRYIDTFREAGFSVQKVGGNIYRLAKMSNRYPNLDNLVYFSEEEAYIVGSLIERLDQTNALKANLHRKLASIYGSMSIGEFIDNKENASSIEALSTAVREKKCVMLHDYASGHSGIVSDRLIEPFAFSTNYIDVWGFEPASGISKVFKIARIGEVKRLDTNWEHEEEHKKKPTDIFRMSGEPVETIKLRLSTLARNLLVEEYPLAEKQLRKVRGQWYLETEIANVLGAGRFVLGLSQEVKIIQGVKLKEYVRQTAETLLKQL